MTPDIMELIYDASGMSEWVDCVLQSCAGPPFAPVEAPPMTRVPHMYRSTPMDMFMCTAVMCRTLLSPGGSSTDDQGPTQYRSTHIDELNDILGMIWDDL